MSSEGSQSALELMQAVRSVLSQIAKPSKVLKTILGQAVSQTGADRGLFAEVTRKGRISYRVLYRFDPDTLGTQVARYSRNIFAQALATGKPVRVENALEDQRFNSEQSVQDLKMTSILCVPILAGEKVTALVLLESDTVSHFQERHVTLLASLTDLAASALEALKAGEGMRQERDSLEERASVASQEIDESRETLARDWSFARFVGRSAVVRELEQQLSRAAATDFPILLQGETGTGKSILARVIHHGGSRSKKTFATVFCPSLEKSMVEPELFGHRKGAFTGAESDRIGKVQAAEQGTLFLDEIGELPLDIQPKLLRLLQEKAYERVGDPTERPADVRVITATNRDLKLEVAERRFRRDLFERLNFVPIYVPPLRDRKEDIPLILRHCMSKHSVGRWIEFTEDADRFLMELEYTWPGNVRHLEHLSARLAMEQPQSAVTPDLLRKLLDTSELDGDSSEPSTARAALELGLPKLLAQEERKWLREALSLHPELTRADLATKLKISEAALYKKLKMYELGR